MDEDGTRRDQLQAAPNGPAGHVHHQFSALLGIGPGNVVAVIGAGGKHTLMYRLGEELAAEAQPVVLTSTTNLHRGADYARLSMLLTGQDENWRANLAGVLARRQRAVLVKSEIASNLYRGSGPESVAEIREVSPKAVVLVKADGARKRLLKAPADYEPVYPPKLDLCVLVLSLAAIGKTLTEKHVHRLERVSRMTCGTVITTQTLIDVVCRPGGYGERLPDGPRNILYLGSCNSDDEFQAAQQIADKTCDFFHMQLCGDTIAGRFYALKE